MTAPCDHLGTTESTALSWDGVSTARYTFRCTACGTVWTEPYPLASVPPARRRRWRKRG